MDYTVQSASIAAMVIVVLVGVAIPIILFLVGRKKLKADIMPFFTGCAVFIVFALVLEGIINSLIFLSPAGAKIQSNIWLYGILGGFMAGLFEETGRFAAFKTVLKKKRDKDVNALMYGAGHGGIEVFILLVVSMSSNIVFSIMLNNGMTEVLTAGVKDTAALVQLDNVFKTLSNTAPEMFLVSIIERIGALVLHISLSVLVWFAAKNRRYILLYPLALLLHMFMDAALVIIASYIKNVLILEGIVYIISGACAILAVAVWKKCRKENVAEVGGSVTEA